MGETVRINEPMNIEPSTSVTHHTNSFIEIENAFGGNLKTYFLSNISGLSDICLLLTQSRNQMTSIILNLLNQYGALKFNIVVEATYHKPLTNEKQLRSFKTKNFTIFLSTSISNVLHRMFKKICDEESEYEGKGSGWSLLSADSILLRFSKYRPLGGSSYIPLPRKIQLKNAVINPQNYRDNKCFLWALLARDVVPKDKAHIVDGKYLRLVNKFNVDGIDFPTPLKHVTKFEKLNSDVSINVYGLSDNNDVYPLRVSKKSAKDHYDLLLITDDTVNSHYCYISSMSRLVRAQLTKAKSKIVICKRCFKHFQGKNKEQLLQKHMFDCENTKPVRIIMPSEENCDNSLKFSNHIHQYRLPFVLYADFECILKPVEKVISNNTKINSIHEPMSFGTYLVSDKHLPEDILNKLPQVPYVYRGVNAAKEFMSYLISLANVIGSILKTNKPLLPMTVVEKERFRSATNCDCCNSEFTMLNRKVRDHCHFSGKFRSILCNSCNLNRKNNKFVPVFIHGSSNYDSHFIVRQLGCDKQEIRVIPNSNEKYITFSKNTVNGVSLRFIDTYKFMSDSLNNLANNLPRDQFIHTIKCFSENDLSLVTRKGVYPYDYTDSWSKLDETSLPPKEMFYNKLNETVIDDSEYEHAQNVWNHFNCQTLGEYSDIYLRIDILLLCDIFENFRNLSIANYSLDCAYYYTLPGLTFDAMLKFTKVELELLTDYDKYLFIEKGIRGGITSCITRHAEANNQFLGNHYDTDKPLSYLTYIDANNLYGWAMTRPMPLNSFDWKTDKLNEFDVLSVPDDSPIGYILEVDIEYPSYLHSIHNELPFLPEIKCPLGSKQAKLLTTLEPKRGYVCHYVNLKQALKHGVLLKKIHRVLQFNQSTWLSPYIKFNTRKRIDSKNAFEKDFYKFIINSMFGKTIENLRKRRNLSLVNTEKRLLKLVSKPTFLNRIIYDESLCAIETKRECLYLNKPIYIGFSVLELSKVLMYHMHYDVMKKLYNSKIKLLYCDTDSLIYNISTDNVYLDIKQNVNVRKYFDMSDLPENHVGYFPENKKKLGFFKDECKGLGMSEFIGLRAKLYTFKTIDNQSNENIVKKVKGITKPSVKRINFDDFKQCLTKSIDCRKQMRTFTSKKHIVCTVTVDKLALNADDNKRFVCDDGITTLAYGHKDLKVKLKRKMIEAISND